MHGKMDLTQSDEYTVRYTTAEDEVFLRQWLQAPGMLHWFSMEEEGEVEEMVKVWINFARFKCSLTAVYQNRPCGIVTLFLMPYIKLIHQSMAYLIVDPAFHRHGIGRSLVRNADHLAAQYFRLERMHYEVYGENPLVMLLKGQGYQELFEQRHYVKEANSYLSRRVLEKVF